MATSIILSGTLWNSIAHGGKVSRSWPPILALFIIFFGKNKI
jgi:hypothetical protein